MKKQQFPRKLNELQKFSNLRVILFIFPITFNNPKTRFFQHPAVPQEQIKILLKNRFAMCGRWEGVMCAMRKGGRRAKKR